MARVLVQLAAGVIVMGSCYRRNTSAPVSNNGDGSTPPREAPVCRPTTWQRRRRHQSGRAARTHTSGSLAGAGARTWRAPQAARDSPQSGRSSCSFLDKADGGYLAFYAIPMRRQLRPSATRELCVRARFYKQGKMEWR